MRPESPQAPNSRAPFPAALTLGLYVAGFAILAWPWLSGSVTIPWDAKSQFFPQLAFLARSIAEGQSPFWTPNVFAGWPQIADPQSLIFSPLHLLLALFNPAPGFRAADGVVFAMLFLGGLGIILIFRERGWHAAGALVAALAFAFGGSNASRLQHIGQIESIAWLPLALFLLMRALDRSSCRAGLAAGLFAGLVANGRDQVALLSLYLLTGYVLWHWLDGPGRWSRLRRSAAPLAAGGIAGLAVVAVPVTLTALLAVDSNRPEVGYAIAIRGSLHPAHLMMLVFADLFGAADPKVDHWGPPSFPWHERFGSTDLFHAQNIGQLYMGATVAVAAAGFGIVRGYLWAREARFFAVAMALVLLYALGRHTPVFRVLYELLPGVSLYRRPADASFPFCALLAICGGYSVHRWLTGSDRGVPGWQWIAWIGLGAAVLAAAVGLAIETAQTAVLALPLAMTLVTVTAACGALAWTRQLARHGPAAAIGILAAFSTADLAINNAPHESNALPPSFYDALRPGTGNETVALLKSRLAAPHAPDRRDRVELIGIGYHWPNIGLVQGFEHLFGHNPLRLADFDAATNASDTVAVPDQRRFSALLPSYNSPLEALFGVRLIATGVPAGAIDSSLGPGDLALLARTKDAYVYENPRALPRVMLLGDWRHANFADMIRTGLWPDADLRRTVLLEKPPPDFVPGGAGGTARIASYRNTEVTVETEAAAPSILVLNDAWHPWWRVCVDGAPAGLLKANVLFRAVAVPAGRHTVRFAFRPFASTFGRWWPGSRAVSTCHGTYPALRK